MRVAIVTESFLPQVNGVANTVRHIVDRLVTRGHEPLVIAPAPGPGHYGDVEVLRVRSFDLPRYRSFPVALPDLSVERRLAAFRPDLVHLASPIVLGAAGLRAARRLDLPTVAVYQTDVAGFARHYGLRVDPLLARWVAHLHRRATRTLVPSHASREHLEGWDVPNLHLWRRGISLDLFGPRQRDPLLVRSWTGGDPSLTVVGYVGRLAAEKQVRRLREVAAVPGIQLVVVGDGPERPWLERHLPGARFTGLLRGAELARAFASLDVFVHTGASETFCQTVQEAQASGVAVLAPAAGGPLDLVEHRRTGMLYPPEDASLLRSHVGTLAASPDLRHQLAERALRQVSQRSWPQVVDELLDVHYAAVLAPAGHAGHPTAA
ncbi:glycosyltransferase family 4 protein [Nocardioides mesophilus]|uniref:Glycosyltransferase family 1 protein n=1 Tax=Nocardioides mesophilus TaxID=433659 RepID=A0A7G9RER8_9ACTN|nr:glycosyltransferase family 1 protein [Nocardioides mesophilus]QNN54093.1 glycosyltransferase family 1 protein [Nocardioides mesophilus]